MKFVPLFVLGSALVLSLEGGAQEVVPHGAPYHGDHWPVPHRCAVPSDTGHYIGYWVGGGALSRRKGNLPHFEEGTWGWDYRGWLIPRRVNLLWLHGRRSQGGTGHYFTEGPHLPHLPHGGGDHNGHGGHEENGHGGNGHGGNGHDGNGHGAPGKAGAGSHGPGGGH